MMKNQMHSPTFLRLTLLGLHPGYADFQTMSGLDQSTLSSGTLLLQSGLVYGFEILSWLNEHIYKKSSSLSEVTIELFAFRNGANSRFADKDLLKIAVWQVSGVKPLAYRDQPVTNERETRSLQVLELSYQQLNLVYPIP